jgi:dTMP kinase
MQTPIPGGFLVVVEGIDGSGKSTVAAMLAQYCGERGLDCVYTKEPTSVGAGRRLRDSMQSGRLTLEEELELFLEDRRAHTQRTLAPALAADAIIVLDRYFWSTAAYQGARGANVEVVLERNRVFAPEPDLVLLFDLPAEVARDRIRGRGDSLNTFEETAYQTRVREIFLQVMKTSINGVKLDATLPPREVARLALAAFLEKAEAKINRSPLTPPQQDAARRTLWAS